MLEVQGQFHDGGRKLDSQSQALENRRRSDRLSIVLPIDVSGIGITGKPFCEKAATTVVSRYGCSLALPRPLQLDQQVCLRRVGSDAQASGRVVAAMGEQGNAFLYGVGMNESCESLWDEIRFSSSFSFYEQLLDTLHDGVYFVDRDRKIAYWNEGARKLSGYSAREAVGKHCFNNFLGHVDETGRPLCASGCPLSAVLLDGKAREAEIFLRHSNGHRVPISVRVLPMRNKDGSIVGAVEVFSDSTMKQQTEKRIGELEGLAFRDSLTNLQNRRYLELKVEQALEEHKGFGRDYGLLLLDLDRFKHVNDTYGHESGDAILNVVAETLVQSLRTVDLVGRWGGEEFLVLLPDVSASFLGDLAERCRALIARSSIKCGASDVSVTASIGVTLLSHDDSASSAIRRADELMYESKRSGGDRTTAG